VKPIQKVLQSGNNKLCSADNKENADGNNNRRTQISASDADDDSEAQTQAQTQANTNTNTNNHRLKQQTLWFADIVVVAALALFLLLSVCR